MTPPRSETYMPTYNPNACPINQFIGLVLTVAGIFLILFSFLVGFQAVMVPHMAIFYTSLFTPSFLFSTPVGFTIYILNVINYVWQTLMLYAFIIVLCDVILGVAPQFILLLREYICRPLKYQKAIQEFRSVKNLPMLYRHMQILNILILDIVSFVIIPLQTISSYLAIYCNFVLIKQRNNMSLGLTTILSLWMAMSMIATLLLLEIAASLYQLTKKALISMKQKRNWGTQRDRKYMGKFVKSCRPLSIGYGKTYVIRKGSVLKFLKFVARGTFRTLLALKR
ncbi:unnamed protein product [Orchesella dallaii]|uniref:Uncharacterized protein n=1 Tax=Orchesella dallaii TaxID=48710 RepID=A0ABP1Q164_9HEXA